MTHHQITEELARKLSEKLSKEAREFAGYSLSHHSIGMGLYIAAMEAAETLDNYAAWKAGQDAPVPDGVVTALNDIANADRLDTAQSIAKSALVMLAAAKEDSHGR